MSFFGSQKIDGKELQECLAVYEAESKIIAFQTKEADLFNKALVQYGNSIMEKGPPAAEDMRKATIRLSQAAHEILIRHEEIKNIPTSTSDMHSAWGATFEANAAWASAMVAAITSNMFALLGQAEGMNPQIVRAQERAGELQEAWEKADEEDKKLLKRLKVRAEDIAEIEARATKIALADDWEPILDPNAVELHVGLAVIYEDEDLYDEAIKELQESIRLEPKVAADAHFRMGIIYRDFLDKPDDAIKEFKEVININPNDNAAHDCLGRAYEKAGRLDEAIKEYKEALRIYPDDGGNHESLGKIYHELGKLDDAIKEFKEAIRLDPKSASAYYELGDIYSNLGNFKEALEHYQKFNRLAPTMPFYASFVEEVNNKIRQLKENI